MISFRQKVKENVLPIVNRLTRPLSLKLVGRGDPNRNFTEFFEHLRTLGMDFQTVIDVGVAFGTNALYDSIPKAKFYLVEPVPRVLPVLKQIATRVNAEIHNVAAGAHDGEIEFNVHDDVSGSSALKQVEGASLDGQTQKIPVRRLDSIVTGTIARPCLLKIDTQGFELEVLAGVAGILDQIDAIIIECSFHEFRHGAPEVFDVMKRMDELGFACYETLEGHFRPLDNALAQVDFAFVPKSSPLRKEKGVFSTEQLEKYVGQAG